VTAASKQYVATLTEWDVPTQASGISSIALDQSGSCCWFAEYNGNKLGHFNPRANSFEEWTIPSSGANPYDLAVTSISGSASVWGTEYGTDKIFAFSPSGDIFNEYTIPEYGAGIGYISAEPTGPQVRIWFSESTRNVNGEIIYDPVTGNATLYEDYFPSSMGGGAYGVFAQSNSVWFAGFSAIARWDRATQQYTVWPLPSHGSSIGRFITIDPYGEAWYTQGTQNKTSDSNYLGVLRSNGVIEEWRIPSIGADPQRLAINPQTQQAWITERSLSLNNGAIAVLTNSSNANLFSATPTTYPSGGTPTALSFIKSTVTPKTTTVAPESRSISGIGENQFTEFPLGPTGPRDIVTDSQGNLWLSEPNTNKIAEITALTQDFALNAVPATMAIPQGGSGAVSITGTAISGYQGDIAISTLNLPQGITASSVTNTLTISPGIGNATIQLSVNVGSNVTAGTTAIMFEGYDGVIAHTTSILLTIKNNSLGTPAKSQCLIATAVYGSNFSQQVALLRAFRDNLLQSKGGSLFLTIFNSWYYSFSPEVANYLRIHSASREVLMILLYPLVESLGFSARVYAGFASDPESAAILSGLVASCLLGSIYLGLPLFLTKRLFRISLRPGIWLCGVLTSGAVGGLILGLELNSGGILMIAGSTMLLSAMWGSGALIADLTSALGHLLRYECAAQIIVINTSHETP
jgi:streptogramin lyase